jgi:hypothetical protein
MSSLVDFGYRFVRDLLNYIIKLFAITLDSALLYHIKIP